MTTSMTSFTSTFAILLLICALIPHLIHAQDQEESASPAGSDTMMVFGDGQSESGTTEYDYEDLVKELYGTDKINLDTLKTQAAAEGKSKQRTRGPAPGMFKNSGFNGSYLSFNAASPFAVSGELESWYSYIDAGVAIKLPYQVYVESIPLYFLFEVATFSFENTYPQGGSFAGVSYIIQASAIGEQSSAAIGFGYWDSEVGSMLELGYRFRPTTNSFIRVGTRGVLITDIDTIGPAWWAELRLSMGIEL